jgi:hypothetical protein
MPGGAEETAAPPDISSSGISAASVRSLASREAFAHRLQREWKSKIKRAELY